ncbi:MAG: hypothetical protein PHY04_00385 [Candidatus ainarchaeum sp.]|nr:hypothetical protein [Candidatus ainarchaeum sp.]MDD4128180.1 hypothetical protein [Candidatus ainarchaeum sp.]MDD4468107.1 hypothetical protein [Candidatus ainarchaeum sp.]
MNSIEALLSLIAITISISILINAVILQEKNFQNASDSLNAKTNSMKCAFIIDSIVSNSAKQYNKEINCNAIENKITSKTNNKTKTTYIITNAKNEQQLEVNNFEHYK